MEVRVLRYNEDARYNPSDFEPYLVEIPDDAEHEVDFGGNDHDPEGAKALLDVLKPQLSFRILKASKADRTPSSQGLEETDPLRGRMPPSARL